MSLEQTEFYPGKIGAKAGRFAEKDPAEALRLVMKSHPNGSEKEWWDAFREMVSSDEKFIEGMAIYCFKNLMQAYRHYSHEAAAVRVMRRQETLQSTETMVTRGLKRHTEIMHGILMDVELSCGKLVRNATFADCKKESGWLADIAKAGKPNQIVGRQLTEQQLAAIWKRHYKKT